MDVDVKRSARSTKTSSAWTTFSQFNNCFSLVTFVLSNGVFDARKIVKTAWDKESRTLEVTIDSTFIHDLIQKFVVYYLFL